MSDIANDLCQKMSGRVVIIDDKYEEIEDFLNFFNQKGVSYLYYDGSKQNLPSNPLEGIRYLFLDLELFPGTISDKNRISVIVGTVLNIISQSNGPYIVLFWTQHSEDIGSIKSFLNDSKIPPAQYVNLEKNTFLREKDKFKYVEQKLNEAIQTIEAIDLYIQWEEVLKKASCKFITELFNLIPINEDTWSENTYALFYKLYKTFVEKNITDDNYYQFKAACHLLNRSFLDYLEKETDHVVLPEKFDLKDKELDEAVVAKFNRSLFFQHYKPYNKKTGACYKVDDEEFLKALKNDIFKESKVPEQSCLIKTVITPECDIAQNKLLKINNDEKSLFLHRLIYGVLQEVDDISYIEFKKWIKDSNKESKFIVKPFLYSDNRAVIIYHFSSLSTEAMDISENEPDFVLQRDLLFDLQSKASNHLNRLGNFMLE